MSSPQSALRTITLRTCQVVQQQLLQNQASHTQDAIILQCELYCTGTCAWLYSCQLHVDLVHKKMLYDSVIDVCMCIMMHV